MNRSDGTGVHGTVDRTFFFAFLRQNVGEKKIFEKISPIELKKVACRRFDTFR